MKKEQIIILNFINKNIYNPTRIRRQMEIEISFRVCEN